MSQVSTSDELSPDELSPDELSLDTLTFILEHETELTIKPAQIAEFRKYLESARSTYCGRLGDAPDVLTSGESVFFRHMQRVHRRDAQRSKSILIRVSF
jgi:hypothetical protein